MNYFFKYLVPQLLDYFHNDKEAVKDFIPKIIEQQYNNLLLEYKVNDDNVDKNETND